MGFLIFFFIFSWPFVSRAFRSAGVEVAAGVATEKPGPTCTLTQNPNLSIIYLPRGPAGVGAERSGFQGAALHRPG